MGDPAAKELTQRVAKARQRALREKQQRLDSALKQLPELGQGIGNVDGNVVIQKKLHASGAIWRAIKRSISPRWSS